MTTRAALRRPGAPGGLRAPGVRPATMPLHARIGADLETAIMSGALRPGDRISPEHALMTQYGCARMTVSKALSRLAEAGLIERRKRAGSFVAAPPVHRAQLEIPDIRAVILARGAIYRLDLLARQLRIATPADRRDLRCTADRDTRPNSDSVLALTCRHRADGVPFALEHRLISLAAVPDADMVDFAHEPPGSWLLGHVPWTAAEHRIDAVAVDAEVAAALNIAPGSACLLLERWTWSGTPRTCITHARHWFPAGAMPLAAHFAAG